MIHELSIEYNPFNCSWQLVNEAGDITDTFTPPADRATVFPLAAEIAKNQPALAARAWRAAELATAGHVDMMLMPRNWDGAQVATVVSQEKINHSDDKTSPKLYTIRHHRHHDDLATTPPHLYSCECRDFHGRAPRLDQQKYCKHILAYLLVKEQTQRSQTPSDAAPGWLSKKYRDMTEAEKAAFRAHQGMIDRKAAESNRQRWQTYNALEQQRQRSPLAMSQAQLEHHADYHW